MPREEERCSKKGRGGKKKRVWQGKGREEVLGSMPVEKAMENIGERGRHTHPPRERELGSAMYADSPALHSVPVTRHSDKSLSLKSLEQPLILATRRYQLKQTAKERIIPPL